MKNKDKYNLSELKKEWSYSPSTGSVTRIYDKDDKLITILQSVEYGSFYAVMKWLEEESNV